jgi:hypothetical protein
MGSGFSRGLERENEIDYRNCIGVPERRGFSESRKLFTKE